MIKTLHRAALKLAKKSQVSFDSYLSEVEVQFSNNALKDIRKNYERRVVERFMENYVKGMIECILVRGGGDLFVRCSKHDGLFRVTYWRCECGELERTGVACSHLILLATLTKERHYRYLVDSRWRK